MTVKKSELFKDVYKNFKLACDSQNPRLNQLLHEFPETRTTEANDLFEIIELFNEYSKITHCIALTQTLCSYLPVESDIIEDVNLFNPTDVFKLVGDVLDSPKQ